MAQPGKTALEARLEVQKLNELPAMSLVVHQFMQAIQDVDVGIDHLAHIIEKDPALLARIIGVANSAYFSPPEPVTSAEDAIFKVLGVNTTKSLALGIILSGPFDASRCPDFPLDDFWLECIFTATLAQSMAGLIRLNEAPSPGEAYLAGLLHKIGLLALVHLYPDTMNTVSGKRKDTCSPAELLRLEQEALQTDHAEVGAWLARKWHLPHLIVQVMENYLEPTYRGTHWPLVQLIGFCSRWAASAVHNGTDDDYPCLSELELLGIDIAHAGKQLGKVALQLDDLRLLANEFAQV
jgi:HD-like signal output (HDOD) protein